MRRLAWAIAVLVGVAALTIVPGTSASADNYNTDCNRGNGVCRPDANPSHWCQGFGGYPRLADSVQWSVNNAHNTTAINMSPMAECTASADARFREGGGLSNLVLGEYRCTDWAGANYPQVCYSSDVIVNISAHNYYADDPDNIVPSSDGWVEAGEIELNFDMSACHELGHQLGLQHHDLAWYRTFDNDCMRSPWLEAEAANDGWRKYNQHHRDHVNAYY